MLSMRRTFMFRSNHLPPPIIPAIPVVTDVLSEGIERVDRDIPPQTSTPSANIENVTHQPPPYVEPPQQFTYPSPRVLKIFKRSPPVDVNDCGFKIYTMDMGLIALTKQEQEPADIAVVALELPEDDLTMLLACLKDMNHTEEVARHGDGKVYVWGICSLYIKDGEFVAGMMRRVYSQASGLRI